MLILDEARPKEKGEKKRKLHIPQKFGNFGDFED
jgi:hypothetical protein